jgi:hypothetical protein
MTPTIRVNRPQNRHEDRPAPPHGEPCGYGEHLVIGIDHN